MALTTSPSTVDRFTREGIPLIRRVSYATIDLVKAAAEELEVPGLQKEKEVVDAIVNLLFSFATEKQIKEWVDEVLDFDGWLEWASDRAINWAPLKWGTKIAAKTAVKWTYESLKNSGVDV